MTDYIAIARRALQEKRVGGGPQIAPVPEPAPVSDTTVERAAIETAIEILNRVGARQWIDAEGRHTIGLWKASDTSEVRYAIRTLFSTSRVVHLEDPDVPAKYRLHPLQASTPPEVQGVSWAEWKAGLVNRLFRSLGNTGKPGRITPRTVRRGMCSREVPGASGEGQEDSRE